MKICISGVKKEKKDIKKDKDGEGDLNRILKWELEKKLEYLRKHDSLKRAQLQHN